MITRPGPDPEPTHHLAQLNLARLLHPLDAPENAEFLDALDPINALAESSPGFVWRLRGDDGVSSTYVPVPGVDDALVVANYSVWTGVETLRHFVNRSGHGAYLRRRREWFAPFDGPTTVCWWIEPGHIPPLAEAYQRLLRLRDHGPSAEGWPMTKPCPRPSI
jgi:hypothetical protein